MKKQHLPKLRVNVETIRMLTGTDLQRAAGGVPRATFDAASHCGCATSYATNGCLTTNTSERGCP